MTSINQTQKQHRSSIKACIIETWKAFAHEVKGFLKYLWIHLLIGGLGLSLLLAIASELYTDYFQPVQLYAASGADPEMAQTAFAPSWTTWGTAVVALAACLLGLALMKGAIFSQIRFYKATDQLPLTGPFTFMSAIKQDARRTLNFDLIFFGVLLVSGILIGLLAGVTSPWVGLLFLPILLYCLVIGYNARLQHVVENQPLTTALKNGFRLGHRKFGGYLIGLLLTGIPLLLIAYIVFQPLVVLQLALNADTVSHLANNPSGIPSFVMPMFILTGTLGFFLFGVIFALQQWVFALYTSAFCSAKAEESTPDTAA